MSMSGGTGGTDGTSGRYLIRGDYGNHLTERQMTDTVTMVWGSVGLVFGLFIGMGLSSLFGLSTVFRVVLVTALALVVGGGTAWIARRIARRGTEDQRVAEFLAESGSAESAGAAGDARGDAER